MPAQRLIDFDTWRPGYGGATVTIYLAGTTAPAPVYTDEALSVAADNPQTLQNIVISNIAYGMWDAPLYVGVAVELNVNGTETGGVIRPPITDLVGEDISNASLWRDGEGGEGGATQTTPALVLQRTIYATDFGPLANNAATNALTLTTAINEASGLSGSDVMIPAGSYPFTSLNLPAGVILRGAGREATTLVSVTGNTVIDITGDAAGLRDLTLDGSTRVNNSIGVRSIGNNEVRFDNVLVKRFATGLHFKGAQRCQWSGLTIDSCTTGAKLHGDTDAGGGSDGGTFQFNRWIGGLVENCITLGVELSYEDALCGENLLVGVGFEGSVATALKVNGARYTSLIGCWMKDNAANLVLQDDGDTTPAARALNTVIGFNMLNGYIEDGSLSLTGYCSNIKFDQVFFKGTEVPVSLSSVQRNIAVVDCDESPVTFTGSDQKRWTRYSSASVGQTFTITTDDSWTKVWSMPLEPGQVCFLEGKVAGTGQNTVDSGEFWKAVSAKRPGSTLDVTGVTTVWTVGDTLQGATSGVTALLVDTNITGTTGDITLILISGAFIDGETINGTTAPGVGVANGTLTAHDAVLKGAVLDVRADRKDNVNWGCTFVASGPDIELQAVGDVDVVVRWQAQGIVVI